jgi:beta-galactosidase
MFHGGTTRGFMNGANMSRRDPYSPQTSSYDYDAPLDEAGNTTPKYFKFREIIQKHLAPGEKLPPVPANNKTMAIKDINLDTRIPLYFNLPTPVISDKPLCFEDLNQGYGFVMYRTTLKDTTGGLLKIKELRDFATVYIDGTRVAVLDRHFKQDSVQLSKLPANAILDILVENNGRINYGPFLTDNRQGITEKVTLAGTELTGWKMFQFPMNDLNLFKYHTNKSTSFIADPKEHFFTNFASSPVLYKGTFNLTKTADTYLDMSQFGKGFVFLNGHNLGKYWYVGPQQTLYVPKSWLKAGQNEIVVFDELKGGHTNISTLDKPILNTVVKEQ